MNRLLSSQFLFHINSVSLEKADRWFLASGLIALALAAVFKLAAVYAPSPVDKKFRQKFFNLFIFVGVAEIVWYGFRYENVRFFGTHFVALLLLLTGLIWLIFVVVQIGRGYSREMQTFQKEQIKLKYLQK